MSEKGRLGRREFLGRAALAAVAIPAAWTARPKEVRAAESAASAGTPKLTKQQMKRIAIEEHWSNKESTDLRVQWGKRTGYPVTVDPKAIPYAFVRYPDFEKFRLPLMDASGQPLANDLVDGQQVEILSWRPRSREGIAYQIRRTVDGSEWWIGAQYLRKQAVADPVEAPVASHARR